MDLFTIKAFQAAFILAPAATVKWFRGCGRGIGGRVGAVLWRVAGGCVALSAGDASGCSGPVFCPHAAVVVAVLSGRV